MADGRVGSAGAAAEPVGDPLATAPGRRALGWGAAATERPRSDRGEGLHHVGDDVARLLDAHAQANERGINPDLRELFV